MQHGVMDRRRRPAGTRRRVQNDRGRQRRANHEIPEHIVLARRQRDMASRGRRTRSGLPSSQCAARRAPGRRMLGSPSGAPAVGPAAKRVDLGGCQPPLADERRIARFRQPRRHLTRRRCGVAISSARDLRVLVRQQVERRALSGPMAGRAVRARDRRDVAASTSGRTAARCVSVAAQPAATAITAREHDGRKPRAMPLAC